MISQGSEGDPPLGSWGCVRRGTLSDRPRVEMLLDRPRLPTCSRMGPCICTSLYLPTVVCSEGPHTPLANKANSEASNLLMRMTC